MSIVITGASGHLGRSTAELVLGRVPASDVVLTTRHPEELSDLAERGEGAPVVEGVRADSVGGFQLALSGGLTLDVFPDHSLPGEHWRLFSPGADAEHFVVTGEGIEAE